MKQPFEKDLPGLRVRKAALSALQGIFFNEKPLHDATESALRGAGLEARDAAFTRAIIMTVLRKLGQIDAVITQFLREPLPVRAGPCELILRICAAETIFMDVPAHASVSLAVSLANQDERSRHFKSLVNAISRRVAAEGKQLAAKQDPERLNTPAWIWQSWVRDFGEHVAQEIAHAHQIEPPLDITVRSNAQDWAALLGGSVLPTGTLRRSTGGRIEDLPGFKDGQWWVQDAAAAIPARFLGDVAGLNVIDLCAAPGGKTAQLAAAGARVTAVDHDFNRMKRVMANLQRLHLQAEVEIADVEQWRPKKLADAVLLDAPCTATGTIRRHPDIPWRKDQSDVTAQAALQLRLLNAAAQMVKSKGTLIYCVCSLAREESAEVISEFLGEHQSFARWPVAADEIQGQAQFLTETGDLRTLPCHWPDLGGLDGFYACRMRRVA